MPKFENADVALEYAKRVAAIRAGDVVKISNEDNSGLIRAVFMGACNDSGFPVFIVYLPKRGTLATAIVSWNGIVLD